MPAPLQAAAALLRREWVGLLRQPADWLTPLAFVVSVVALFPLGLGPARLRELAPGLLWIVALLASLLSLPRLFAADLADGSLDQWWLSPLPRPLAVALKLAVHWGWTGLPLVLLAVLVYTLAKKDLGREHQPRISGRAEAAAAGGIALAVGFYDGLFGPGTGSFFVFLFVRLLGYDFLRASATAKLMNLVTNAFALALFVSQGHIWWHVAAVMALTNVAGSLLGTRLALKHGAGFVRIVFIVVVGILILKTAWDAFLR